MGFLVDLTRFKPETKVNAFFENIFKSFQQFEVTNLI